MNVIAAMRLPLSVDLGGFVKMLRRLQVPHRVVEQGQEQILWVPESLAEGVRELYQRYPEGNDEIQLPEEVLAGMAQRPSLAEQARGLVDAEQVVVLVEDLEVLRVEMPFWGMPHVSSWARLADPKPDPI